MTDTICSFTSPSGTECNKDAVYTHNDIHMCNSKSHWPTSELYDKYQDRARNIFNESTLAVDAIQIKKITKDGACFYRTIAKFLYDNSDEYNVDVFDYDETALSAKVQHELNEFIYSHRGLFIKQCAQKLEDIVIQTHIDNISSLEEYHELYDIFAGDDDYTIVDKVNKNGRKIKVRKSIPDRWGSTAEQIAFAILYKTKVNVFLLQKFDKRSLTVKEVTKRAKDIRLKLYQSINPEMEGVECNDCELNIILEKQTGMSHYLYISN
jgi:hypothetical protein